MTSGCPTAATTAGTTTATEDTTTATAAATRIHIATATTAEEEVVAASRSVLITTVEVFYSPIWRDFKAKARSAAIQHMRSFASSALDAVDTSESMIQAEAVVVEASLAVGLVLLLRLLPVESVTLVRWLLPRASGGKTRSASFHW